MRQSLLFTKTIKEIPKDETSLNAQLLMRAGFIDKLSAGVYTFLPLGLRVLNKINAIIREEMNMLGAQEVLMPALTPKSIWEKTNRWDDFDALFKLEGSDSREYALGATHEEVVTPLAQAFCSSYKNFPFAIYQIQTKFRNEKRAKAGLIRGREFVMKDLYSFHSSQEDLDAYYEKVKEAYFRIYQRIGLGDFTYLTYASGGAFSKYSHEFQTITEAGEDLIYLCENCKVAINEEIVEEQNVCPLCANSDLKEKKAVEVGNIFKLANKFSKAFKYTFSDNESKQQDVLMACFGMGPSRIMATIVEVLNDANSVIWPKTVAPFAIHLISFNQNEEADILYNKLLELGFDVLYDDRESLSLGEKLMDADLISCPLRILLSSKSLANNQFELKNRNEKEAFMIDKDNLLNFLQKHV